jgi:hypothetical protein
MGVTEVAKAGSRQTALLITFLLAAAPCVADDVSGASQLLCAARSAASCTPSGCSAISLDEFNIPDFVQVDLKESVLRTTVASGTPRATPIASVTRRDGNAYLQGVEMGRAWSILIVETTGQLTFSVAREELSVTVFGVCTPLPIPFE